jgi:hypothetical protein
MTLRSFLVAALALPALGCAESSGPTSTSRLALQVAPLELPGVADACYAIAVHNVAKTLVNPAALVWSEADICASQYGNATGSITYVGTCDASPSGRINTVSLVVNGLCKTAGCDVANATDPGRIAPDTYVNPCPTTRPCQVERPCNSNADTLVEFNLTIMRDASQGFFDIAVSFEDIFCSAKLDCVPELLHRPGGGRDLTAVLAFACTSGADTCLYVDPPTLTCTNGASNGSWTLDPTAGPGNISENSPVLYGAAVYKGDEAYTTFEKRYWNVALGLDEAALANAGDCTLTWNATASEGFWEDLTTPSESVYPMVTWSRQITTDGVLDCDAHGLNVVLPNETTASVATVYTETDEPHTFAYSNCEPGDPEDPSDCNCPEGFVPNATETACERLSVVPTVNVTTYDVCAGFSDPAVGYTARGARFSTSSNPSDFEFASSTNQGCTNPSVCLEVNTATWQGRLAEVGVWTCPAPTDFFSLQPPYNEWLGFSHCLTVDTAGDYLVGIAGDNDVLLRVNGDVVYQSVSGENFVTWNVLRLPLSAGTHVVELFGLNRDTFAAFGAEIAGPFPAGSLTTPAAMRDAGYLDNIIWSTADMRTGPTQQFQTSTGANAASGLSCPAGFALDLCGAPAMCISDELTTCDPR